ncbi:MAG: DUF5050 domain-containing protein [Clostridium sp.]
MKNKFLLIFLIASTFLISCSNSNKTATKDNFVGINNTQLPNTTPPEPSILISEKTTQYSPYQSLGNLIFFPDKENNNRLSSIYKQDKSGYIEQSSIKDIFNYQAESIAIINETIYFSNGSDSNSLYSLDYQRNETKKINNNYAFNLTSNLDTLYYINKNDKNKLYFYNTTNLKSSTLTSDNVGKFIINGDYILYQNLSDKANLYSIKLDGSKRTKLTDNSVNSFTTYKNEIIYINSDDNNTLYRLNPTTNTSTRLNLVHGENLKVFDDKLFIIDSDNSNNLSSVTIDFEKNTATTTQLISGTINNFFPSGDGVFLEKSPDVNKSYILK